MPIATVSVALTSIRWSWRDSSRSFRVSAAVGTGGNRTVASAARYHSRSVPAPPPRNPAEARFGQEDLRRLRAGDRAVRGRIWEALDAALRRKILAGGDRVSTRFRAILRDVPTAEDFIADRAFRLVEGLALGRVGIQFDEQSGDLIDYLTQSSLLRKKAIQWRADRLVDEQALAAGTDGDDGWRTPMETVAVAGAGSRSGDAGRGIDRLLRMPFTPDFAGAGGPTQRRFVVMQFWPRLEEAIRESRRDEIRQALAAAGSTLADLEREHDAARARIEGELSRLDATRTDGRARTPRAEAEFERSVRSLRVECLIHPLDAAGVRRLLGVSESNAFQLKRRLVANLEAILPDLAALLGEPDSRTETDP